METLGQIPASKTIKSNLKSERFRKGAASVSLIVSPLVTSPFVAPRAEENPTSREKQRTDKLICRRVRPADSNLLRVSGFPVTYFEVIGEFFASPQRKISRRHARKPNWDKFVPWDRNVLLYPKLPYEKLFVWIISHRIFFMYRNPPPWLNIKKIYKAEELTKAETLMFAK